MRQSESTINSSKKRGRKRKIDTISCTDELANKNRNEGTQCLVEINSDDCASNQPDKPVDDVPQTWGMIHESNFLGEHDVGILQENVLSIQNRLLISNLAQCIQAEMQDAKFKEAKFSSTLDSVICAICQNDVAKSQWNAHRLKEHQNIAWTTTEEALDLTNVSQMMSLINKLYESKMCYKCNVCGDSKKSSLGFLSHKVTCNKTQDQIEKLKINCNQCDKSLMPFQLVLHERTHRQNAIKKEEQMKDDRDVNLSSKRKAAQKATALLKEITHEERSCEPHLSKKLVRGMERCGLNNKSITEFLSNDIRLKGSAKCFHFACEYNFTELEEALNHIKICQQKISLYYRCKICNMFFNNQIDGNRHFEEMHSGNLNSNDDNGSETCYDSDSSEESECEFRDSNSNKAVGDESRTFWSLKQFSALTSDDDFFKIKAKNIKSFAYNFTLNFANYNYVDKLFAEFPANNDNWRVLDKSGISSYFPKYKSSVYVRFKRNRKDIQPKNYILFESSIDEGVATIFCGGSVTAMAWAPTCHTLMDVPQVLAVAIKPDPDMKHFNNMNYSYKSLIQFWNFGCLNNKDAISQRPQLVTCIAHCFGKVTCLEWCPSGCHQVRGPRIGVLSIACSNGMVYGFSICKQYVSKLVHPAPCFKLALGISFENNLDRKQYYPTKISWTKAKGHKYVAVAYSQGIVALFNLNSSNSCCSKNDSIITFYPYLSFQAHSSTISGLCLHYLNGGNSYLVTGGVTDRLVHFWNLKDNSRIPTTSVRKTPVRDLLVPSYGISAIACFDETSNSGSLSTCIIHPKELTDQIVNLMTSKAAVAALSSADWAGIFYQGNESGDISCVSIKNLHPACENMRFEKLNLTETSAIVKTKPKGDRSLYKDNTLSELIFIDSNLKIKPKSVAEKSGSATVDVSAFPLQSINAIATNPNINSFLFTAAGYNVGFVRVFHCKFLV